MIQPTFDRLLVRRQSMEEFLGVDSTLLSLPETARAAYDRMPQYADVLAVGPEVNIPGLCVGSRIVCGRWAGSDIKIDDQQCIIICEREVLALVS